MIINLICIGSKPNASEKESIEYYTKQLPKNFNVNFTYLKNLNSSKLSTKEIIKRESAILLNNIPHDSYVISWDSEGRQISSADFANLIKQKIQSRKSISFLVGGSHGFTNEVKHKSDMVLSASLLTFPHKLFRLILVEQIYRAHTILANMPYHK